MASFKVLIFAILISGTKVSSSPFEMATMHPENQTNQHNADSAAGFHSNFPDNEEQPHWSPPHHTEIGQVNTTTYHHEYQDQNHEYGHDQNSQTFGNIENSEPPKHGLQTSPQTSNQDTWGDKRTKRHVHLDLGFQHLPLAYHGYHHDHAHHHFDDHGHHHHFDDYHHHHHHHGDHWH